LKAILTVLGSNPYHPAYGSAVTTRIGAKAIAATQSLIRSDIQTALERVKSLQAAQGKYQAVSAEERLYAINNVQVDTDPNDPTTFQAQVTVKNASNRTVLLNIVFTVPGVVALKGTNGLSLGIQPTVIGNA
jgi:ABC-type branched-subunit amino acid transport system substrate-binding protein